MIDIPSGRNKKQIKLINKLSNQNEVSFFSKKVAFIKLANLLIKPKKEIDKHHIISVPSPKLPKLDFIEFSKHYEETLSPRFKNKDCLAENVRKNNDLQQRFKWIFKKTNYSYDQVQAPSVKKRREQVLQRFYIISQITSIP